MNQSVVVRIPLPSFRRGRTKERVIHHGAAFQFSRVEGEEARKDTMPICAHVQASSFTWLIELIDKSRMIQLPQKMQIPHRQRAHFFRFRRFHAAEPISVGHGLNVRIRFRRQLGDAVVRHAARFGLASSSSLREFFQFLPCACARNECPAPAREPTARRSGHICSSAVTVVVNVGPLIIGSRGNCST